MQTYAFFPDVRINYDFLSVGMVGQFRVNTSQYNHVLYITQI